MHLLTNISFFFLSNLYKIIVHKRLIPSEGEDTSPHYVSVVQWEKNHQSTFVEHVNETQSSLSTRMMMISNTWLALAYPCKMINLFLLRSMLSPKFDLVHKHQDNVETLMTTMLNHMGCPISRYHNIRFVKIFTCSYCSMYDVEKLSWLSFIACAGWWCSI